MIVLSTGRNSLDKVSIKLTSPSITFYSRDAVLLEGTRSRLCSFPGINMVLVDEGDDSFVASTDEIQMEGVEEDTDLTFLVPHSDASALTALVCL